MNERGEPIAHRPRIEGASAEQLKILRELLADLGSVRITGVGVREFDPRYEEDVRTPPGRDGDEVVIATSPKDRRGEWEAGLLARSFARRSKSAGLTKVAWFSFGGGGATLAHIGPATAPLDVDAIDRCAAQLAAVAGDATLEQFDVLRLEGHAVAIAVRVGEPHAFLRLRSQTFLRSLAEWRERCDGIYAEIRDAEPTPALTVGWFQDGGFSSVRHDVECCAPLLGLSRGISDKGPPPCPVFG